MVYCTEVSTAQANGQCYDKLEGPGDVIRLARKDLLAIALMSNVPTDEQCEVISDLAWQFAEGRVVAMLDLNPEGRHGMLKLIERICVDTYARVAWTSRLAAGRFLNREPEDLTDEELAIIRDNLAARAPKRKRGLFSLP